MLTRFVQQRKKKQTAFRVDVIRASIGFRCLPAAAPAATAAAATTVATAFSATAAAITPAATAAGVLSFGARFVHVERAPAHLLAIQRCNGFFSILVAGHFHEAEAARAPGIAVGHDADPVHLPEGLKHLPQLVFRCVEAQVPYENILHSSSSALRCRSASSMRADWQVGNPFLKIRTGAGEQIKCGRSIAGLSNWSDHVTKK
jgi:hypothetical protein